MANKITIEYVKNPEKAGKLTLIDEEGNKLLSKVPVSIPTSIPDISNRSVAVRRQNIFAEDAYLKDTAYNTTLGYIKVLGGNERITSLNESLFYGCEFQTDKMHRDAKYFVLNKSDFNILKTVLNTDSTVNFEIKPVMFLWNAVQVSDNQDLDQNIRTLKSHKDRIDRENEATWNNNQKTTTQSGTNGGAYKTQKDSAKIAVEAYPIKNTNKTTSYTKKTTTVTQSDDLDAFDVMFMYNYPELAPMYRPNSMLAWVMYFNENEANQANINSYINNNSVFDNVDNNNFHYTPNGYKVELYDNNQNLQGTLVCDGGNYTLEHPNGQTTVLDVDNTGRAIGCVMSDGTPTTTFDFVPQDNGFVGNWTTQPSDGMAVSSGIVLDNDFAPTSEPYKTNDLDSINNQYQPHSAPAIDMGSDMGISATQDYEPHATPAFDMKPEPKWEATKEDDKTWEKEDSYVPPPPPPPPPPPKDDDYGWSASQDSYGNTTSFRM